MFGACLCREESQSHTDHHGQHAAQHAAGFCGRRSLSHRAGRVLCRHAAGQIHGESRPCRHWELQFLVSEAFAAGDIRLSSKAGSAVTDIKGWGVQGMLKGTGPASCHVVSWDVTCVTHLDVALQGGGLLSCPPLHVAHREAPALPDKLAETHGTVDCPGRQPRTAIWQLPNPAACVKKLLFFTSHFVCRAC